MTNPNASERKKGSSMLKYASPNPNTLRCSDFFMLFSEGFGVVGFFGAGLGGFGVYMSFGGGFRQRDKQKNQ